MRLAEDGLAASPAMDRVGGRSAGDQAAARKEFKATKKLAGETREQFESRLKPLLGKCDFVDVDDIVDMLVSREFPEEDLEPPSQSAKQATEVDEQTTEATDPSEPTAFPPGVPNPQAGNSSGPTEDYPEASTSGRRTPEATKQYKGPTGAKPKIQDGKPTTKPMLESGGKTRGAADGAGVDFERNYQTLLYLRMLFQSTLFNGFEFQLASNMAAAGLFDDIVLRHRKDPDAEWDVSLLQLKTKKNNNIQKADLLGISGAFSLVNYCDSYEAIKSSGKFPNNHNVIIFTNAGIADCFVEEVASDPLLFTSGKAVSFKAGGDIYEGLCELVVFKQALTDLQGQTGDFIAQTIKTFFNAGTKTKNNAVDSWKKELMSTPTVGKLEDLLKKLEPVRDEATYASFLSKLQVYVDQAKESILEEKIREELDKLWKCSVKDEAGKMFRSLIDGVKSFREKGKGDLTQDSSLWLDLIKSQLDTLSKSTIEGLTKTGAEFESESLRVLHEAIPSEGIVNVRVDSRTEASSLRVHQALAKFRGKDPAMHVNLNAFLEREADVLAAWNTRWCRVLVLECDKEIERSEAERIRGEILKIIGREKLLFLIAPENHWINVQLPGKHKPITDTCKWDDLTVCGKKRVLESSTIIFQGSEQKLSELLSDQDKERLGELADLEVISQLMTGVTCGKELAKDGDNFVKRQLKSKDGKTLAVDSVDDIKGKVVLVVAEAGMGKSTLMTRLANRAKTEDPKAWIVLIRLNDCSEYLAEMDKDKLNDDAARNFLEHFALSSPGNIFSDFPDLRPTNLEKIIYDLLKKHKLLIILDGVDEVCPFYKERMFTLLGYIKGFQFTKLCVASRSLFKKKLVAELGVEAHTIDPLSIDDQTDFFNNFWKMNHFSDAECEAKTGELHRFLATLSQKDRQIVGAPLITAMLAEVYHRFQSELVRHGRLNETFLYRMYLEKRFQVLIAEQENKCTVKNAIMLANWKNYIKRNHCLAALRVLFSRTEIESLIFESTTEFKSLNKFLRDINTGKEKSGIIEHVIFPGSFPIFTHRSICEYLVALWLKDNFEKNKKLTIQISTMPNYNLISKMFSKLLLPKEDALHLAVLHRDLEETKNLSLSEVKDKGGRTALHLAVLLSVTDPHEDCIAIVKTLVEKNKEMCCIVDTIAGWTPFHYAEKILAWEALDVFLQNGVKSNEAWPEFDQDVMLDAAKKASVAVVRYLAEERGGDLKCQGPKGEGIIHIAAKRGKVDMLKYLAEKGLLFDGKDNKDITALHYTTHEDNGSAIDFLLERNVDLEAVNNRGLTALQLAAWNKAYDVMDILIERGASFQYNPDKASKLQMNMSLLCAAFAGSLESVQQLVNMGAVRYKMKNGCSAARFAIYRKHYDVMDWLLIQGPEDSLLHGACRTGDSVVLTHIIDRGGADIEGKGWDGQTPLIAAARNGNLALSTILFTLGPKVDSIDNCGRTALHWAADKGRKQVAALLLCHGADAHAQDAEGKTPLRLADWLKAMVAEDTALQRVSSEEEGQANVIGADLQ